ncbi:RHS repeat-associated protein [Pedobacter sp. W3I1]|uniref:DUF6443 domain-containing protein n=1 Tax=Pedobacter sp. W3I1 TaxID=3042291 RepID=UPI002781D005|nr:DUF6443 domain-containing protein [Pedobacter sp. W3I1]MDQ0639854.1 RHS repeat-associated protein [Pedobacter sp. W3I1]
MKQHLKYFCAAALLLLCSRSSGQKVVSVYNGESEISAPLSVTLSDGFHTTGPVHIFTTGLSYVNCMPFVSAASSSQNYISTKIFKQSGIDPNNLSGRSICDVNETIQYFDGLGRPLQTVQVQGSPGFKDIVQPIAYDAFGREKFKYQPYAAQTGTTGSFRDAAIADQFNFFHLPAVAGIKATDYPFAETVFEASPLNRVQQQGAPGEVWQISAGHTVKAEYGTNLENEVKLWIINGSDNGAAATVYGPGKLYKTISKDENWKLTDIKAGTTEEFKDFEGRVILKRVWETDGKSLSTYYVYDDLGNLRYVLPPAVNENGQAVLSNFDETLPVFDQFIYGYHYDGRKRLVEKKIPGKGWEFMVYNKLDQVTHIQDANQRAVSQWSWIKYDAFGRVVLTGVENGQGIGRIGMQNYNDGVAAQWEERTTVNLEGYTRNTHPSAGEDNLNIVFLTANYYDDYDFPDSFGQPTGNQAPAARTKSLLTGSKVKNLGTGAMLLTVNYYDLEGRVVQSKSNHQLNGSDVVDNTYSFVGELTTSTRTHTANGTTTTIAYRFEYDHMGRKLATFENINHQGEVALNHLGYNEIGQLNKKNLHNDTQATTFAYNERGWMKNSTSDQFSLKLDYEDGVAQGYNGNITKQYWDWTNTLNPTANIFNYGYDKLNRLETAATVAGVPMSESLTYDVMGNIASLNRDGGGARTYNYYNSGNSNRLQSVSGLTTQDYEYDANGNATKDGLNGFRLTYNYLNLPATAVRITGTPVNLSYTYDATGNKLAKNSNGSVRNYIDGIEYKPDGTTIDIIHTEEGVAQNNGSGTYTYHYNLSDHLGNVRYTFDVANGIISPLQKDDYYAFGKRNTSMQGSADNKYLYNGKELQDELGQYDYGARFYDPVIGRWNVIDPLADEFEHVSPYNYAMNNPVLMIDEFGMAADTTKKVNPTPKPEPKPIQLKEVEVKGWRWPAWTFNIPIIGAAAESGNNLSDGNYGTSAAKFGQALLELFTAGFAYEAKTGVTIATKTGTTVYASVTKEGVTQYVGITNNLARRAAQHLASKGIIIEPLMKGLSRTEARAVEQALIEIHGLGKNGGTLLNKINSISTSNPSYGAQLQKGYELLKSIGYK